MAKTGEKREAGREEEYVREREEFPHRDGKKETRKGIERGDKPLMVEARRSEKRG